MLICSLQHNISLPFLVVSHDFDSKFFIRFSLRWKSCWVHSVMSQNGKRMAVVGPVFSRNVWWGCGLSQRRFFPINISINISRYQHYMVMLLKVVFILEATSVLWSMVNRTARYTQWTTCYQPHGKVPIVQDRGHSQNLRNDSAHTAMLNLLGQIICSFWSCNCTEGDPSNTNIIIQCNIYSFQQVC